MYDGSILKVLNDETEVGLVVKPPYLVDGLSVKAFVAAPGSVMVYSDVITSPETVTYTVSVCNEGNAVNIVL